MTEYQENRQHVKPGLILSLTNKNLVPINLWYGTPNVRPWTSAAKDEACTEVIMPEVHDEMVFEQNNFPDSKEDVK
jgi:hypothetical protein